jgi:class 3 adenylate cyclase
MKPRLVILLLAGLIVLAVPLLFFNNLLNTARQRTEDAAMALLREKMLQETERIKGLMRPENYVKETIRKVHGELMPEVTSEIVRMLPEPDFGSEIFDARLPKNFLSGMRARRLDPLFITVTSPAFADIFYWFADQLNQQCPEPDKLSVALAYRLVSVSTRLYEHYYQQGWTNLSFSAITRQMINFGFENGSALEFKYLNRFSEYVLPHGTVKELFTDYFGRQSIYVYAYNCISRRNIHGSYIIGVLQSSIRPLDILSNTLKEASKQFDVGFADLPGQQTGFLETDDSLAYYDQPPTEFLNHISFFKRYHGEKATRVSDNFNLCLRARPPAEVLEMRKGQLIFRLAAGLLFLGYLMAAVHYWLFGLNLRLAIRKKLLLLLAVIIFIPAAGTGLLTVFSLHGSERLIENHVLKKTQDFICRFVMYDNENDMHQQLAMLEIKRRIEEYQGKALNPALILPRDDDNLLWLRALTDNHSWISQDGTILHFSNSLHALERDSDKLLNAILPKYLGNLGLLSRQGNTMADTLTLGIFEDYITPEREEASLPHETTMQHDISHTLETSRAAVILAKSPGLGYIFAYPRSNDGDFRTHAYLGEFSIEWKARFSDNDSYCDIELAARLRRQNDLNMHAWPGHNLTDDEMLEVFNRALETRDTGSRIFHSESGVKTWAWSHRPTKAALFAAIGRSRGRGIGQLILGMVFPALVGYGILVIMVLSLLFAEFIVKPVGIFSEGVKRLSHEEYGVQIARFSGDEFSQITSAFNKMSAALRQREMIKRLVSTRLLEKVENRTDVGAAKTEKQIVSVAASDIRGFTSLSEKFAPSEVVELLNTYFTAMEEAISQHHGVIDKYIGDAIQIVFYDVPGLPGTACRACQTAMAMRRKLKELNRERERQGLFALENGIGVATGVAISGSIGSRTGRKDFTIIGRVTEQAAQLEARTVNTVNRILVCNETKAALPENFSLGKHDSESWELLDEC